MVFVIPFFTFSPRHPRMKEALSRFKDTVKGEIRKALKVLRNDEDVEEMDTSDSAISPFGFFSS